MARVPGSQDRRPRGRNDRDGLGSGPVSVDGEDPALEPPRVFEYEWKVAPVPEMPLGENAVFRYELTPRGGSTLLTVTYRRITAGTARGFLPGLHAFLDRLEAQLEGAPLPDWMTRFTELLGQYPEWTKHATPSAK
jgi:hypothetical protein